MYPLARGDNKRVISRVAMETVRSEKKRVGVARELRVEYNQKGSGVRQRDRRVWSTVTRTPGAHPKSIESGSKINQNETREAKTKPAGNALSKA